MECENFLTAPIALIGSTASRCSTWINSIPLERSSKIKSSLWREQRRIHSALLQRSRSPRCRPDPASSPTQSRARRQLLRWYLAQRPSHGNPLHRQMPGLLLAFGLSLVPRPALGEVPESRFQGMLHLLGPAYLPTIGVFQPSQVASGCCLTTAPLGPELRRHPRRMYLSNSLAL
jgi:hypothetical protein